MVFIVEPFQSVNTQWLQKLVVQYQNAQIIPFGAQTKRWHVPFGRRAHSFVKRIILVRYSSHLSRVLIALFWAITCTKVYSTIQNAQFISFGAKWNTDAPGMVGKLTVTLSPLSPSAFFAWRSSVRDAPENQKRIDFLLSSPNSFAAGRHSSCDKHSCNGTNAEYCAKYARFGLFSLAQNIERTKNESTFCCLRQIPSQQVDIHRTINTATMEQTLKT